MHSRRDSHCLPRNVPGNRSMARIMANAVMSIIIATRYGFGRNLVFTDII